jgi:hypothetical protein
VDMSVTLYRSEAVLKAAAAQAVRREA